MGPDSATAVIVADDGELEDVRRVLERLGIEFDEAPGDGARCGLLISNARHAVTRQPGSADPVGLFHIVVVDKVSKTIRREVERLGPDFLLQRPVDPGALRLLVLHALYRGPERRRAERAAMCAVVSYRTHRISRKATLVDLSERGCRLTSERALESGSALTLMLPRELTGSGRLSLASRVVEAGRMEGPPGGGHTASIAFERVDTTAQRLLASIMERHAVGSAPMRLRSESRAEHTMLHSSPSPNQAPATNPADPCERRGSERKLFESSVLAAGRGGALILIGRDLSKGGMRVAPEAELSVGDEFNLVVHGLRDRGSTLVRATVIRDDGEAGWVLRFGELSQEASAALERVMASLPSLGDGAAEGERHPNVVVSERVECAE